MGKTLKDLTFKDNFMFTAVMLDSENCRLVLELILGISIEKVEVDKEKSFVYHPEYKGVRLDVVAKDEHHSRYDIEMQLTSTPIEKRARYYHSQMDSDALLTGSDYKNLPKCFVVFICDYDPFGLSKYKYTCTTRFQEDLNYIYDDGANSVFLNTKGTNAEDEPVELVQFLKFAGSSLDHINDDFNNDLVKRLQQSIDHIKKDRDMEARYMQFEELLNDEFNKGFSEGISQGYTNGCINNILSLLEDCGTLSEDLKNQLTSIEDLEILKKLVKVAAKTTSLENFEESMNLLLKK